MMNNISDNQIALVVMGSLYLIVVGIIAWRIKNRANALLLSIKEYGPEGLWDELGKPKTMQLVVRDSKRR